MFYAILTIVLTTIFSWVYITIDAWLDEAKKPVMWVGKYIVYAVWLSGCFWMLYISLAFLYLYHHTTPEVFWKVIRVGFTFGFGV